MIRIHRWLKQQRVIAIDARGRYLSIPLDFEIPFEIVPDKKRTCKYLFPFLSRNLFDEPLCQSQHILHGCTRKFTSNSYFLLSTPRKDSNITFKKFILTDQSDLPFSTTVDDVTNDRSHVYKRARTAKLHQAQNIHWSVTRNHNI